MVDVAIAQYAPGLDKQSNLEQLTKLASEAAESGARIVVAPEYAMFTAPSMDSRFVLTAESLDGEFVSALEIGREHV